MTDIKDILVEKITVYIASTQGYDNLTDIIDTLKSESRSTGAYTVIHWENPVEYELVEKGDL